ncbi:hybrid sensor histidine kinase/response regulator [Methylovulum psychrotolerans]|uniref:Chemotaxis protein CheA n=1 Tax=Methylovulum psychrotolerans TaxID=1704499 RepID=A0A1Z4BVJ6_9GAMM|nr:hybrid sensor histidine kinase/response regulator [Methylovulum psychrotolerans]ASF45316.1 hypothetical protein CEK71_04115 [Methylovulum psychrotolerans]
MTKGYHLGIEPDWPSDPLALMEKLAELSVQRGYFALQDANWVLAEIISTRQSEPTLSDGSTIESLLAEWVGMVENYWANPRAAVSGIIMYLRRSELKVPLAEEEFSLLAEQLLNEAGNLGENLEEAIGEDTLSGTEAISRDILLASLEILAEQAGNQGWYGLQDANLLLLETLMEADFEGLGKTVLDQLTVWPEWVNRYAEQPQQSIAAIMALLHEPCLGIPMADNEFALLQDQLTNEVFDVTKSPTLFHEAIEATETETETETAIAEQEPAISDELVRLMLLQTDKVRSRLFGIIVGDEISVRAGLREGNYEMGNFANSAKTAGFSGLSRICWHIKANLQQYLLACGDFTQGQLDLLLAWLDQAKDYLPSYDDADAAQLLVSGLMDEEWDLPLGYEEMADCLRQIRYDGALTEAGDGQAEAPRKTVANPDDVSLALPEDVNTELLDMLLQELPMRTGQFADAVQRLRAGNREALDIAQRAAHTLKGSANTVGIKGIAILTHHIEDILIACADAAMLPGLELGNALMNAVDCLESMTESLLSQSPPPQDALAVLQDILDWANRIDDEGVPDSENSPARPADSAAPEVVDENSEQNALGQIAMMRVSVGQIENLLRLSGENIILNSQVSATMHRIKTQLQAMQTQFSQLKRLNIELEQLIDLKDLSSKTFMANSSDFDALEMDQYNELHTTTRRLIEASVDAREINVDAMKEIEQMDEVLTYQQQVMMDTQEAIMKTRLVPIASIVSRLQRALRQTCRLTAKDCELSIIGDSLLIDSDMLNTLVDPLMHILRNAVDHGIEPSEERASLGKPPQGLITIQFEQDGNALVIRCRDDGRGLNFAAIRQTAERRGVIQPNQALSEDELASIILRPNFSTRSETTQTSGRGVGMDAVHFHVTAMGGSLVLHSEQGQGLTVELRMPLPLSRFHALIANAGPFRVAISSKMISQVFYSGIDDIRHTDGQAMLYLDGQSYPVKTLNKLLNMPDRLASGQAHGAVLLVQYNGGITAVLLDNIIDSIDIVIKSLGPYLKKIPGVMGATIMGDGLVAPVLDVAELLSSGSRVRGNLAIFEPDSDEPEEALPIILVVDDSLSQRRSLELLLHDTGFRVITARDGIEAVNLMQKSKPALVLTDLEMPRMNGIELAAHIRANTAIKTVPVLMITSRTTLKHRKMAEQAGVNAYLVKPVSEDILLANMQSLMAVTP